MKRMVSKTAYGILALLALTDASRAGSQLLPGISTGLSIGAALPEGLYDVIMPNYGWRNSNPQTDVGVLVPSWIVWSTPWTIFGGRLIFDTTAGIANISVHGVQQWGGVGNPILESQLKWDLGGGWSGGFEAGVYLPVGNQLSAIGVTHNYATFQGTGAVTYNKDGWTLDATAVYGTGRNGSLADPGSWSPDWFNIDLTALKAFGKFQVGAIGYGSWDVNSPVPGYKQQSQFALGGIVTYDFGAATLQLKLARDIYQQNYGGYQTNFGANIITTLWAPPARTAAVVAKY